MNESEMIDVAIIGAGPAGMTAGMYASRAGLKAVLFEGLAVGGQVSTIKTIDNYPGFPEGVDGFDLAWSCKQQAERFGTQMVNERVVSVDLAAQPKLIVTDAGQYQARTVIVATGARNRKMGIAGEDELRGRGVSYCATCDGNFFRGKNVVVYGGGDAALEDALYLSRVCAQVTVVFRRAAFKAAQVHVEAAGQQENIDFKMRTAIAALQEADGKLAGVQLKNLDTGELADFAADAVFVAIGNVPNSGLFAGQLELDGEYVVAGEDCATNLPGVFAAGDVRTKKLRQVVTAVSDGAVAAEAAAAAIASGGL